VPAHDILRIPEHGFGKPEERAYNHAMEVLGVGPDETWMVGDNLEWEIVAPQRLGIYAVWHDGYGVGLPLDSPIRPRTASPAACRNCCCSRASRCASLFRSHRPTPFRQSCPRRRGACATQRRPFTT
jgi:hypothetical protein